MTITIYPLNGNMFVYRFDVASSFYSHIDLLKESFCRLIVLPIRILCRRNYSNLSLILALRRLRRNLLFIVIQSRSQIFGMTHEVTFFIKPSRKATREHEKSW
ncbi:hypothetical protein A2V82_00460 [candidate division KSB1 bacterium RBG_16_48_16]|nr:MAG: hypothetical protein A2V82_00460 [candidate division KSB1 bacterium RBG_16_48_16]